VTAQSQPFAELRAELARVRAIAGRKHIICTIADAQTLLAHYDGVPALKPATLSGPRLATDEDYAAGACIHFERIVGEVYFVSANGGMFACKACAEKMSR